MSQGTRAAEGEPPNRGVARRLAKSRRRWRVYPYQWLNLAIIGVYLGVCLAGITTSNLGIDVLRQDMQAAHPDTLGNSQDVRSDEYLVDTPLALWTLTAPGEAVVGEMSALSGWTMRIPTGPAQTVLFWDRAILSLGQVIPPAIAFALQWWLPHLLVLLGLPALLHLFGARRRYGYGAALLVILSPAQTWWSMQPSVILGPAIVGSVAMLAAHQRLKRGQWVIPALQLLIGAALLASMTSRYVVWVLLLGGAVLGASVVHVLFDRSRWLAKLVTVVGCGAVSLLLTVAAVIESRAGLATFLSTVYPAARRSSAVAQGLASTFGAPALGGLAGNEVLATNASEISTSFNIVIVLIALLIPTQFPTFRSWLNRPVEVFLGLWILVWFLWGTVSLGKLGESLPLLNMVPSYRAIQVIGFVGLLLFFLMLSHLVVVPRKWITTLSLVAAWLTVYAGSVLQKEHVHKLSTWIIWAAGIGVGVSAFMLLRWSRSYWSMLIAAALAATISVNSLPIQIGLGDLRGSALSRHLVEQGALARTEGKVWASDSITFDSLMVATGVPSLSGFQRSGPNRDQWHRLDPDEESINSWNRSAGYARFNWVNGASISISDNDFDVVTVRTDPCKLAQLIPELTHIVSAKRLSSACLTPSGTYGWGKYRMTEYTIGR